MFWTIPDNPPPSPDCFLVLSYAVKNRERPTKPTCAEIELAYQWWKKFPRAKLIMSTGDNQQLGVNNSTIMADYARQLRVPYEYIIEEDRSINTRENLIYSKEIMDAQNLRQPTLVTLDLYTPRAVATAKKLGWKDFYWLSAFSHGESAYGTKGIQTHSRATIFMYELIAMLYSKLVGWV